MSHQRTRLALLISAIGLGMPAAQRALAGEHDGLTDVGAPALEIVRPQTDATTAQREAGSLPQVSPEPSEESHVCPVAQRPRGLLAKLGHLLRGFFLGHAPTAEDAPDCAKQIKPVRHEPIAAVPHAATVSTSQAQLAQGLEESHARNVLSKRVLLDGELESGRPVQSEPAAAPVPQAHAAPQAEVEPDTHNEHAVVDLLLALDPTPSAQPDAASQPDAQPVRTASPAAASSPSPLPGVTVAMSERSLDRVRGGFTAPDGLQVSFGIERAVYINGALVTTTRLNVASPGHAGGAAQAPYTGQFALIQNGAGNTVVPGAVSPGAVPTVIQNTLDGQKIQNLTVINATVNSLQVLKGLQLQSAVTSAIVDSLRR